MLCPNCGSDDPSSRTACAVCGADLRLSDVETFDPAQANGNERSAFEDSLWPPPAVFVLEEDEENILELPAPVTQFEDAQADDVFEQSLSGVKLEDLAEDDEDQAEAGTEEEIQLERQPEPEPEPELEPEVSVPPSVAEPLPTTEALPRDEAVDVPPVEALEAEEIVPVTKASQSVAPFMFQVVERQTLIPEPLIELGPTAIVAEPTEAPRKKSRAALWMLGGLLAVAAAFGAGAIAGSWYAARNLPQAQTANETPPIADVPPAAPATPAGMVLVQGGDFLMGSDEGDELSRPAHFVSINPFFIDRTEVTNESYRKFVDATGYDPPATWKDGVFANGEEEMPVTGVTWYDAAAFAAWAGKRLPTEAEWEFAARGSDGRKYPWGNEWDPSIANVDNTIKSLRRVGEGAATPTGIYDMAGNAWEWTASDARSYPGGIEFPKSRLRLKIIRGGNYKSNSESASSIFRGFYGASGERDYSSTSFRCVKDIPN